MQLATVVLLLAALPFTGRILYDEDPLERADVVFVLAGGRALRWLEARDLIAEGYAPLILLSAGLRDSIEWRLEERGVHVPDEAELARTGLQQFGLPARAIEVLPGYPDNTADEAQRLRALALTRGWRRVIVVTSKLHTRRTGFAFRRELDGTPIRVIVRATRYDSDDPSWWWRRRRTIRAVMYEAPKLVAYLFGLGP